MRDVRTVFGGLAIAAVIAVGRARRRGRAPDRPGAHAGGRSGEVRSGWSSVVVGLGVVALVAFDTLFAVFHQAPLPGGLLRLRPGHGAARPALPVPVLAGDAIAVGLVIIALSAVVAHRGPPTRGPARRARPPADPATRRVAEPG